MDVQLQVHLIVIIHLALLHTLFHLFQHVFQVLADEYGDDGRWCFVGTQTVIVARRGNRGTQQVGMFAYCLDGIDEEGEELQVGLWSLTGRQQVLARVGTHAPVVVLAGAVDEGKWLLVEQHTQFVAACNPIHQVHQQLIVIYGNVHLLEYGGTLKLCGCNLVVASTHRNTQLVRLNLEFLHETDYSLRNRAEVVVFQLLPLGRCMAEYGATGEYQVWTSEEQGFVYQEVFLLPAQSREHLIYVAVKVSANSNGSFFQRMHGLEQRRFEVECLTGVAHEDGGHTQCFVGADFHDESGR